MNILENKRVIGTSAAFLVAFGALVFYGFHCGGQASEAATTLDDYAKKLNSYSGADFKPKTETVESLGKAVNRVSASVKTMEGELKPYLAHCDEIRGYKDEENLDDFSGIERCHKKNKQKLEKIAGETHCTLAEEAKDLGMSNVSADKRQLYPYIRFQMYAVGEIAELIMRSGATSISRIYCKDCKEIKELAPIVNPADGEVDPNDEPAVIPMSFEVTFDAPRNGKAASGGQGPQSPLVGVLNGITANKKFFVVPTGIYVQPIATYTATEPVPDKKDGELASGGDATVVAVQRTGKADEKIRVHMTFQVYYFTGKDIIPQN